MSDRKIYTKRGDQGETNLLYGGRVSKTSLHTEAYGVIDEAVSTLGLARSLSEDDDVKDLIVQLQRELFVVMSELATDPDWYENFLKHFNPTTQEMVDNLERTIDSFEERAKVPKLFTLPGGSPPSSAINMARAMIRTAERRVVALNDAGRLTNPIILTYMNRLGDLLFALARFQDRDIPIERATGERKQ